MTNIKALIKLAKAMGIAAPEIPSDLSISWNGKTTDLDVLEIKADSTVVQTLYKVSDLTPTKEELVDGKIVGSDGIVAPLENGELKETNNALMKDVNCVSTNNFIIVYDTLFNCGGGVPGEQIAPSAGTYFASGVRAISGAPSEGSMGETIADVINYMADNYPATT